MDKYPHTHIGLWLVVAGLVFASVPASAQNGNTRSNSHQVVLHIRVNIVNTVMLPPAIQNYGIDSAVTYKVQAAKPKVEVREEVRPLSPDDSDTNGVLKTVTVVTR